MLNVTGKYVKVWEVKESGKVVKLSLSSSKKNKDNKYENSSWRGRAVGNCFEKAKSLKKEDMIEIISAGIAKYEYEGKRYDIITIFDFNIIGKPEPQKKDNDEIDDLPF